jgi:hypothetical protein
VTESWQAPAKLRHWTCLIKELSPGQVQPHSYTAIVRALCFPKIILSSPLLEAVTIFTDASGRGTAAYYTKDCHKVEHGGFASAQRVEL